jgi:N-acyl-L-homoserine lactone synthetase
MYQGVVLFHTTTSALRAEKILQKAGVSVKLIPTPRELSSDCGIALRFELSDRAEVEKRLASAGVEIEIHSLA